MTTTDAWNKHVLAEARATLASQPQRYVPRAEPTVIHKTHDPEPEPEYRPQLDTTPIGMTADWAAYIERRINERVEEERSTILAAVMGAFDALDIPGLCQGIADAREHGEKRMAEQLREVRAALNEMQSAFAKLAAAEAQHKAIIDLPALPLSRRDVN